MIMIDSNCCGTVHSLLIHGLRMFILNFYLDLFGDYILYFTFVRLFVRLFDFTLLLSPDYA